MIHTELSPRRQAGNRRAAEFLDAADRLRGKPSPPPLFLSQELRRPRQIVSNDGNVFSHHPCYALFKAFRFPSVRNPLVHGCRSYAAAA